MGKMFACMESWALIENICKCCRERIPCMSNVIGSERAVHLSPAAGPSKRLFRTPLPLNLTPALISASIKRWKLPSASHNFPLQSPHSHLRLLLKNYQVIWGYIWLFTKRMPCFVLPFMQLHAPLLSRLLVTLFPASVLSKRARLCICNQPSSRF